MPNVLLLSTGSVASVKVPLIAQELLQYENVAVQVAASESSLVFFDRAAVVSAGAEVWTDADEWKTWTRIGDPILHIELRRWADIVLVAPCSANTLSKLAHGTCDNLCTNVLRALDPATPVFVFPAMNTFMYTHPLTEQHLRVVEDTLKYTVVGPIGKGLACGDNGIGAMTEWRDIVKLVVDHLSLLRKPGAPPADSPPRLLQALNSSQQQQLGLIVQSLDDVQLVEMLAIVQKHAPASLSPSLDSERGGFFALRVRSSPPTPAPERDLQGPALGVRFARPAPSRAARALRQVCPSL
ncbi:flavoprotein [Auriculariales sp. MPI-PUGE-AT-0066]|nr:flavoprotein [Auriculariales sp. MPI-PUGE-AT-0066]